MSSPNPLLPQGSFQSKAARGSSNVRVAVATIVAIHVVFFGGLLLQGCKRDTKLADNTPTEETNVSQFTLPPMATNDYYYTDPNTLPGAASNTYATGTSTSSPAPSTNMDFASGSGFTPEPNQGATGYADPAETQPSNGQAGPMKDYTVVRGDSFYKIAKANGITISAITQANPSVDPNRLQVGTKLKLPPPSQKTSSGGNGTNGSTTNGKTYTVKSGDTLTKIASQHNTTISAIRNANGMRTSRINVGQKLKIPTKSATTNASTSL